VTEPPGEDVRFGRYRIVREIGRGGMGVVYEAWDDVLKRAVALKIVQAGLVGGLDYRARFEREAELLAQVDSRQIVPVFDYGQSGESAYLVTQLFRDGDLQTLLAGSGPLGRVAALRLTAQVAEALQDAHTAGVLHRDVKPSNVLLRRRESELIGYLCDFGIASDGSRGLTLTGSVVGSLSYMAPERHHGDPADQRSDVYSAGCLLWACLKGQPPYVGTDFQIMSGHIGDPVPQLATGDPLDDAIDELLLTTMAKDPAQRPQTARDLRDRLTAVASRFADTARDRDGREAWRSTVGADGLAPTVLKGATPAIAAAESVALTEMRAPVAGPTVRRSRTAETGGTSSEATRALHRRKGIVAAGGVAALALVAAMAVLLLNHGDGTAAAKGGKVVPTVTATPTPVATTLHASPRTATVVQGAKVSLRLTITPCGKGARSVVMERKAPSGAWSSWRTTRLQCTSTKRGAGRLLLTTPTAGTFRYRATSAAVPDQFGAGRSPSLKIVVKPKPEVSTPPPTHVMTTHSQTTTPAKSHPSTKKPTKKSCNPTVRLC